MLHTVFDTLLSEKKFSFTKGRSCTDNYLMLEQFIQKMKDSIQKMHIAQNWVYFIMKIVDKVMSNKSGVKTKVHYVNYLYL